MNEKIAGLVLMAMGLAVLFFSPTNIIPSITPLPSHLQPLYSNVKAAMPGDSSKDAEALSRVLRATANQFVFDVQRPTPFYGDNESMKWAIKNVGDLSYPIGWRMSDRYPTLPSVLENWLSTRLNQDFTREQLVEEMRSVALVLERV